MTVNGPLLSTLEGIDRAAQVIPESVERKTPRRNRESVPPTLVYTVAGAPAPALVTVNAAREISLTVPVLIPGRFASDQVPPPSVETKTLTNSIDA